MTAITKQEIAALPVQFRLNGMNVVGRADETIIQSVFVSSWWILRS